MINFSQLNEIRNYRNDHFILINNINASNTAISNNGLGFEPIGNLENPFTGSFDGAGFAISDLTINRPTELYIGLFGYNEGILKNVTLTDVNITGNDRVGAIAGFNYGRIEDSQVIGVVNGDTQTGGITGTNMGVVVRATTNVDVTGDDNVGGIAGLNENEISESHSTGNVIGTAFRTGGLAGENIGFIQRSSATGNVNGNLYAGGLVGWNRNGEVRESFATGSVSGVERIGGLVGRNDGGSPIISGSYATGSVTGDEAVGGLVGTSSGGSITQTYSAGVITGNEEIGGFAGRNNSTITDSYWDTQNSTQADGVGLGIVSGLTGLQTDQMTGEAAQTNMTGFDWEEVWGVNLPDGYPILLWPEHTNE